MLRNLVGDNYDLMEYNEKFAYVYICNRGSVSYKKNNYEKLFVNPDGSCELTET